MRTRLGPALAAALAVGAALALLGPAAAASPAAPQVSFHVPAQAGGGLEVGSAQWALILLHGGPAGVDLTLPDGASASTRTVVAATVGEPRLLASGYPTPPVETSSEVGPGSATLAFEAGRWASLFVVADRIEATLSGGGRFDRVDAGQPLEQKLPWPPPPRGTLLPHYASADAAALVHGGDGADAGDGRRTLRLSATGLRHIEWYNATADCSMACPDGPSYQEWAMPGTGANRVEVRNYTRLDARGGQASLAGAVEAAVLGGEALDVIVDGWARLPQATLEGCAACGGGRTLRLDGDGLAFHGLASDGRQTGRLRGSLAAPAAQAAVDESALGGLGPVAAGAAAAGGLAVAAALALRGLGVLRVRAAPQPGFGHSRRTGLYELVAGEPGLTFREVERRLGWGNGVTRHHLDVLLSEGHLVARRHLNTVRYFENHGRFDADWQAVVHRRDPGSRWLLEVLEASPRTQREVVELAAIRGWSRSATQRRLGRLVADGLVAAHADGNGRRYSLALTAEPRWAGPPGLPVLPRLGWPGRGTPPAAEGPGALARPAGKAGP